MTIHVTIKNDDPREDAIIMYTKVNPDGSHMQPGIQLKGGQSAKDYIYKGCDIIITEVKNG